MLQRREWRSKIHAGLWLLKVFLSANWNIVYKFCNVQYIPRLMVIISTLRNSNTAQFSAKSKQTINNKTLRTIKKTKDRRVHKHDFVVWAQVEHCPPHVRRTTGDIPSVYTNDPSSVGGDITTCDLHPLGCWNPLMAAALLLLNVFVALKKAKMTLPFEDNLSGGTARKVIVGWTALLSDKDPPGMLSPSHLLLDLHH